MQNKYICMFIICLLGLLPVLAWPNTLEEHTADEPMQPLVSRSPLESSKRSMHLQEKIAQFTIAKVNHQQPSEKIAYLTFDDGPSAITPKVLDILDKYNVKGTFFVIGNNSPFGHQMYKRIVDSGHAIGNHSYSHDYNKIYRSTEAFRQDFERLQDLLEESVGFRPQIMRFPGGSDNTVSWNVGGKRVMYELTRMMLDEGFMYFDWNADSEDADRVNNNKDIIIRAVLSKSRGKGSVIILMHDAPGRRTTVDALPMVIEGLKAQGFVFRTLSPDSFTVHLLRPD